MTGKFTAPMLAAALIALGLPLGPARAGTGETTVIALTQSACQFLEPENGVDHGYTTARKSDCDKINAETGAERLAKAKVMTLRPGRYVFRVTNRNVPYELGFWLREADYDWRNPLHRLTKVSVSGGGLVRGATKDYAVELTPGTYLYSCPLNPTPDYRLVVEG